MNIYLIGILRIIIFSLGLYILIPNQFLYGQEYVLEEAYKRTIPAKNFYVDDFDGDGEEEFVTAGHGLSGALLNDFSKYQFLGETTADIRSPYWIENIMPVDVDSAPGKEIALMLKDVEGDSCWIEIRGYNSGKMVCRTESVRGENTDNRRSNDWDGEVWDGKIHECHDIDLDSDGIKELVVLVSVGFDCNGRGIYVYDCPSGKLRWKFLLGCNPHIPQFADANGDGLMEIYFSTTYTGNKCQRQDFIDTVEHIIALNHDGLLLWKASANSDSRIRGSYMHLCDCDADSVMEIYYLTFIKSEDADQHIRLLEKRRAYDNEFLAKRSFDADRLINRIGSGDINNDGKREIFVNDFPSILEPGNLELIKRLNLSKEQIFLVEDLVEDDLPELVVGGASDSIFIYDNDFNRLASYKIEDHGMLRGAKTFIGPKNRKYLGVHIHKRAEIGYESFIKILQIKPRQATSDAIESFKESEFSPLFAVIIFIMGSAAGIALYAVQNRVRKSVKSAKGESRYDKLLSSLMTFDHGQMSGKNLNRLLLLFGNIPDDDKFEELKPRISSALEAYRSFTRHQLNNIINEGIHFPELREMVCELRDKMDKLNDTVSNLHSSGLDKIDRKLVREQLPDLIENIKVNLKEVRKKVESVYRTDLVQSIKEVLNAISGYLSENGVEIEDIKIDGNFTHPAFCSPSDFTAVLEELINNAVRAMEKSSSRSLRIELEYTPTEAILRLCDSGHGIASDDPNIVFDREYTTKESEGGYGLYHAHQQIQKYGGKIKISNNIGKPGATVTVRLRLLSKE